MGVVDSASAPADYNRQYQQLEKELHLRTVQYIGEGCTFLVVIIIGAAVVYSSIRRRIRLSRQQNNFMLSVTHELKSPIAAMKLNLQTLEKHRLEADQRQHLLTRCITEANRLNDLCNNILVTSQLEGGSYRRSWERFDISEMCEEAVAEYGARYPMRLAEEIDQNLKVNGDKTLLRIVLNNLLENAIKYSGEESHIVVVLRKDNGNAVIQVLDEGPGIAEAEKKKVFDKFYRVGNEESRASKGSGLGLYLVQKIVRQHKGTIVVKNNQPRGSIFEVCLPIVQPARRELAAGR
ncbi:MAG: GHKL domain-containing protein [Chitinophagia bacterium]|nr:GHKL domain-containing protein [Chitinophagia bacterium]